MRAIHWFRSDLRIGDNTALAAACRRAEALAPVFILDDSLLRLHRGAHPRLRFLYACLDDLAAALEDASSRLIVMRGAPRRCLPALGAGGGGGRIGVERAAHSAVEGTRTPCARMIKYGCALRSCEWASGVVRSPARPQDPPPGSASINRLAVDPSPSPVHALTIPETMSTAPMQARAVSDAHRMLLGGGRVDSASGETIPVLNPATRSIFAHVPRAGAEDVDRAVKAAAEAFASRRDLRLFDELEFRDSKCLKQAMDSRFRGNDVISARRVVFRPAVIPAKAGIHFGQRIPKLEFDEDAVGSQNLLMSIHF